MRVVRAAEFGGPEVLVPGIAPEPAAGPGQTFPLEQAADAHRAIEARDVIGKTLLVI